MTVVCPQTTESPSSSLINSDLKLVLSQTQGGPPFPCHWIGHSGVAALVLQQKIG